MFKWLLDFFFPKKEEPKVSSVSKERIAYWTSKDRQRAKEWLGDSWKK